MQRFDIRPLLISSLLGSLLMILAACETVVSIPLPEHQPKLVVYGILNADSALEIQVSRSYGWNEEGGDSTEFLDDAVVEIQIGNESPVRLDYEEEYTPWSWPNQVIGSYIDPQIDLSEGDSIKLTVSHPDYPSVEASTKMIPELTISAVELRQNIAREIYEDGSKGDFQSLLSVSLTDDPETRNYYSFEIAGVIYEDSMGFDTHLGYSSAGFAEIGGSGGAYNSGGWLLSDDDFNGSLVQLDLLLYLYDPSSWFEPFTGQVKYVILHSKVYGGEWGTYWEKYRIQQQANSGFDLIPPEAVIVNSNVEGGYGVLGSWTTRTDTIRL
ncbi:DUF4249 domain-containing protein [Pontibacter sp. G13]|uniref:DUF4249 domain-containing protein n=1 Tax=Pontibacter sp. G13 TaxID=3074898 RepID=UPI00288A5E9C|nr:DUF4249 domain-containing protein [Pontibacter sp. G13]WNJ15954.1 DUF4249 domain-containing protein [Pontibacter sp. G13]